MNIAGSNRRWSATSKAGRFGRYPLPKVWDNRPHECPESGKLPKALEMYSPGAFVRKDKQLYCVRYAYRIRRDGDIFWVFHLEERANMEPVATMVSMFCEAQVKPFSLVVWTPFDSDMTANMQFPIYHYGNGVQVAQRNIRKYEVVPSKA